MMQGVSVDLYLILAVIFLSFVGGDPDIQLMFEAVRKEWYKAGCLCPCTTVNRFSDMILSDTYHGAS